MATVVRGDFEWDDVKAVANFQKHGVSFEEAEGAFDDVDAVTFADPSSEDRFWELGFSRLARLLVVVYEEAGERIRIISARKAVPHEAQLYREE